MKVAKVESAARLYKKKIEQKISKLSSRIHLIDSIVYLPILISMNCRAFTNKEYMLAEVGNVCVHTSAI
jgi:hypothetical protein